MADGEGEISETSRPLKDGEVGEWVLLDGVCMLLSRDRMLKQHVDIVCLIPDACDLC